MASRSEKAYMSMVAELPCSCCGDNTPVELHHIREGQGGSQRASHFLVIPLCVGCHRDNKLGFHGERINWRIYKKDELTCLADTINKIFNKLNR